MYQPIPQYPPPPIYGTDMSYQADYPPAQPGSGYPPTSGGGYPPTSGGGYPPISGGSYPPTSSSGYPATSSGGGGYPATSSGGYPNVPPNNFPPQQPTGGYPQVSPGYPPGGPGNQPQTGSPPPPGLMPEPGPTAPSLDQIQKVPGYEHITFQDEIIQPPVAPGWDQQPPPERPQISSMPSLTDEEIRDAVSSYASDHCCYGNKVSKDMEIRNVERMSAFRYVLETFGEKRESAWRLEPYDGRPIDGPMNGPAPGPWDVQARPNQFFQNGKLKMEVPHTAFVKPCHTCVGIGRVRCSTCAGIGQKVCTWCNGSGKRFSDDTCTSCNGAGRSRCISCNATGQEKCDTCKGKQQLKGYVELTITWNNHFEDYISETSSLPKEKIRKVTGDVVFEEEQPKVWPITHSGDEGVNRASHDLVTKHGQDFVNERILKQKHYLSIIPVAHVTYEFKGQSGEFYVFGFENKVFFHDYPQSCCCGCTIL